MRNDLGFGFSDDNPSYYDDIWIGTLGYFRDPVDYSDDEGWS